MWILMGWWIRRKNKMTSGSMITFQARQWALRAHANQMYGEHDYSYHLKQVAGSVYEAHCSDSHICVAYLHDILEDTDVTEALLRAHFSAEVVDAVVAITKIDGEKYSDYIAKVAANKIALDVKLQDTLCNLTESLKTGQWGRVRKYAEQMKQLAIYK